MDLRPLSINPFIKRLIAEFMKSNTSDNQHGSRNMRVYGLCREDEHFRVGMDESEWLSRGVNVILEGASLAI
jgi:hypothetical protein